MWLSKHQTYSGLSRSQLMAHETAGLVIAAIDCSKLPVVVLFISKMAGKENLDCDFSCLRKRPRQLVSLGLDSSALLAMRKWQCCRKALCQQTLNRTMPGQCRCFWSGGHSEIGPFPTKRSNVQTISMTLFCWFWFVFYLFGFWLVFCFV